MRPRQVSTLAVAFLAGTVPASADQLFGRGQAGADPSPVMAPGGQILGFSSAGRFIATPDAIRINGSGSSGDITGMSVTPTTTGATSQPLAASVFPRYAPRAFSYGAVGDGTTDDAPALRSAMQAVSTPGLGLGTLTLDSAPGYLVTTGVPLLNGQQWSGGGATLGLKCAVARGPCVTVIGSFSGIHNLPFTFVGKDGSGSVGVQVGRGEQGSSPVLRDVSVSSFGVGVDVQSNVTGKLDNLTVNGSSTSQIGIRFRNVVSPDAGDWTWNGVTVSHPNGRGSLVSYESGGGLKVHGFKGLGGSIGWYLNLPDTTATQDFQFTGSSIENSTVACMKFQRQGGAKKAEFGNVAIVANEFAGCPYGLWFSDGGTVNTVITGNNFSSIAEVPIRLDPGANNIVVGRNSTTSAIMVQDNRTATTDEYGFLDRADTVPISSGSSSTYNVAYTVKLPPYRGASIHVVLEGIVQGVGGFTRDEEFLLTSGPSGVLIVTPKSSVKAGAPISFAIDTSISNTAKISYRLASGKGPLQGTATIVPLGKMISVSRD